MKSVFAALLLTLQLQPLLGTAACLGLVKQPAQSECEMPEHGTVPGQSLSESAPIPTQSCAVASFCVPAPLAVPGLAGVLEITVVLHTTPAIVSLRQPVDASPAGLFHPPRA
jgi:hypothetical protein